jgi:flagellar biosynthetic protein FliR
MQWLTQPDGTRLLWFALVLARVGGLVAVAPIYGTAEVPLRIRAMLAIALALVLTPTQWATQPACQGLAECALVVGSELVVGLVLGLGIVILFSGIELAGEMIAQASGLSLAEVFDPAQGTVSAFSRLLGLVAMAIFMVVGGHRLVMSGLLETFRALPPGSGAAPAALAETMVALVAQSFSLGVRAAVPIVASLLIANLALGMIARTVPQLNTLAVGVGVNSLLVLGALTMSLGAVAWIFQAHLEPMLETLLEGLHG